MRGLSRLEMAGAGVHPPGVLHMNLAVIAGFLLQHAARSQARSCMN